MALINKMFLYWRLVDKQSELFLFFVLFLSYGVLTRRQGWRIIEGRNGFQIASMFDEVLRISIDVSQNYSFSNITSASILENVTAVLLNLNQSMWRVTEENGKY